MDARTLPSMAARHKLLDRFFRRADDGSVYFVWNASDEIKEKVAHILDRAAYHWRRGELDKAIEQAEAALRIAPDSPTANEIAIVYAIEAERSQQLKHMFDRIPRDLANTMPLAVLQAVALAQSGRESDARILVGKFAEQYTNDAYVLFARAEVSYATQQWNAAADTFRTLYGIHADFPYGHIHAAKALLASGDADTARGLLELRLQTQPRNADVYHLLGNCFEALGQITRARQQYREALSIQPDRGESHFRLGCLERRAGQFQAAGQHLRRALEQNPDSTEIVRELLAVYVATKQWDDAHGLIPLLFRARPTWDDVGMLVTALTEGASFPTLETHLVEALKEQPNNVALLYLCGYIAYQNARYAEASRALEAVTQVVSRQEVWLTLARVYRAMDNPSQALEAYSRVIELDPTNIAALSERCQLRIQLKQVQGALDDIETAIAASPEIGQLYYLRARCLLEVGDQQGALESLTLALQRDQHLFDAWVLSSQLWRSRGDYAQAIYALKQVLAEAPDDVAALSAMAETQLAIGRVSAAKQHIARILHLHPEKGEELYLTLGTSLERRNLFNQALDLYEDGLLYFPNSSELRFRCGVAALKSGAFHICNRQIEELSALDPIRATTLRDVLAAMLQAMRQPRP